MSPKVTTQSKNLYGSSAAERERQQKRASAAAAFACILSVPFKTLYLISFAPFFVSERYKEREEWERRDWRMLFELTVRRKAKTKMMKIGKDVRCCTLIYTAVVRYSNIGTDRTRSVTMCPRLALGYRVLPYNDTWHVCGIGLKRAAKILRPAQKRSFKSSTPILSVKLLYSKILIRLKI